MAIIKLFQHGQSHWTIFIRSSGGNKRLPFTCTGRDSKTQRQLRRIRQAKRDIPAQAEIVEVVARPPGKGRKYREMLNRVARGQTTHLVVEDVDRLTHTVSGLGKFWAQRIKHFGLKVYVTTYDPCHPISASMFLALVKTHEEIYQQKVIKRRDKGFARHRRLPACTAIKGGILCVDHIIYCKTILPVFRLARKVALRKGVTKKSVYKEVAILLEQKGLLSCNGIPWTPRNVRRILNCKLYQKEFQMYLEAGIIPPYKRPLSIVSITPISTASRWLGILKFTASKPVTRDRAPP